MATSPTKETQDEAQIIKEVLTVTTATSDELEPLPQKCKTIIVGSWVASISETAEWTINRAPPDQSPLKMEFWVQNTQIRRQDSMKFQEDQLRLNLQKNEHGLYECRDHIKGDEAPFSKKLVMQAHT